MLLKTLLVSVILLISGTTILSKKSSTVVSKNIPVQSANETVDVFHSWDLIPVFSEKKGKVMGERGKKRCLQSIPAYGIFYAGAIVLQGGQPP